MADETDYEKLKRIATAACENQQDMLNFLQDLYGVELDWAGTTTAQHTKAWNLVHRMSDNIRKLNYHGCHP